MGLLKNILLFYSFTFFSAISSQVPSHSAQTYQPPAGIGAPLPEQLPSKQANTYTFKLIDYLSYKQQFEEAKKAHNKTALDFLSDTLQEHFENLVKQAKLPSEKKQELSNLYQLLMLNPSLRIPLAEHTLEMFIAYTSPFTRLEQREKMQASIINMRSRLNQQATLLASHVNETQINIFSLAKLLSNDLIPSLTQTWREWLTTTSAKALYAAGTVTTALIILGIVKGKDIAESVATRIIKPIENRFLKKGPIELAEEFIKKGLIEDAMYHFFKAHARSAQDAIDQKRAQLEGARAIKDSTASLESLKKELKKQEDIFAQAKAQQKSAANETDREAAQFRAEEALHEINLIKIKIQSVNDFNALTKESDKKAYINSLEAELSELKKPHIERLSSLFFNIFWNKLQDPQNRASALKLLENAAQPAGALAKTVTKGILQGHEEKLSDLRELLQRKKLLKQHDPELVKLEKAINEIEQRIKELHQQLEN